MYNREKIIEVILEILSDVFGIYAASAESEIYSLGLDSLDVQELLMEMENKLRCQINDDGISNSFSLFSSEKIMTVSDLADIIISQNA